MASNGRLWSQISQGVAVAGVGIFLLLTTLGITPATFWLALLPFWPVLLIALGLRFMFDRTAMPALTLLSPLLILGTMAFVAMSDTDQPRHEWAPIAVDRTEEVTSLHLNGDLHMSTVHLEAQTSMNGTGLLAGRASVGDMRAAATKAYARGDEARVRLGRYHDRSYRIVSLWGMQRDQWEIGVPTDLPLSINLDAAGTSGEFDLDGVNVKSIRMDGAFNDLEITLGAPERDARIEFEGAFYRVKLHVPHDTRVSYGSDGFMNSIQGRRDRPRNDEPGYRLFLDGAFNRVSVVSP